MSKNILLLTSEFAPINGGIATYAREIALAAAGLGARMTVFAPDYARDCSHEDRQLPFPVRRFSGGLHSMRALPAKIALALGKVGAEDYDIVHAADWPFFIPAALARRRTPARLLMTVHGTEINETQTPLKRLAIRAAGVFGPRTEVAANSRYTRDLFCTRFAIDPACIRAIPLGVSPFWFETGSARAATRTKLGIAADRIVMVTVARITRRKGHHLTAAALATLPEHLRKRMTWLVIGPPGESDYVQELRAIVEQSDCDIRLLGALPNKDIRDIFQAADLFCLTSLPEASGRVEGFGLVYLEAGASGLPSIGTAVGGVPDAVIADQSGLLTPVSVEAVAAAISDIVGHIGKRSGLAAGAQAHAAKLSWTRCAAETYGLPWRDDAETVKPPRMQQRARKPDAVAT